MRGRLINKSDSALPAPLSEHRVAASDVDIDDIAAGIISPQVYMRRGWETDEPVWVHRYSLLPVDDGRSGIFRALAAQLTQRTPAAKQASSALL